MSCLQWRHGEYHTVALWALSNTPNQMEVYMASVKAQYLVQRFPLSGVSCAGEKQTEQCILCESGKETTEHFLLYCTSLETARASQMNFIEQVLNQENLNPEKEDMVKIIMDPSGFQEISKEGRCEMEKLSRRLIFSLHNQRSILLGGPNIRASVSRKIRGVVQKGL